MKDPRSICAAGGIYLANHRENEQNSAGASTARLFVGLELSGGARALLDAARREFAKLACGSLYPPELYHITLCFLGETPRRAIPHLAATLDRIPFAPFELHVDELGSFRDKAILWAGVRRCPELHRLQGAVRDQLEASGFPVEKGAYTPHITLGRKMRLPDELPELEPAAFPIDHITLFESTRKGGQLAYLPLHRSASKL